MCFFSHFVGTENGLAPASSGLEDLREKGELQKAYYSFLHAITSSNLTHILPASASETLHQALTALVAGDAGKIDPGTRETCLQVGNSIRHLLLTFLSGSCPLSSLVACVCKS